MEPMAFFALDDEFVGLRNVNGLAYAKPDQLSTIVNRLVAFRTYSFTFRLRLFVDDLDLLSMIWPHSVQPKLSPA